MIKLNLIKAPNQSLSPTLNNMFWEITIKVANNIMIADIVRDGVVLVRGQRVVADAPIIPFRYLSLHGNFAVLTPNGELPWWEKFDSTHELVYFSPEELGLPVDD